MVLPAAAPRRTSKADRVAALPPAGVVQATDAAADAPSRTNGAIVPSSIGRNEAAMPPSGPGDDDEATPPASSEPAIVAPRKPPSVQRSPRRRSSDVVSAQRVKDASTLPPAVENVRRVSEKVPAAPTRHRRSGSSPLQYRRPVGPTGGATPHAGAVRPENVTAAATSDPTASGSERLTEVTI
jgi:hypothetical protein